jgi:hypothetical protein
MKNTVVVCTLEYLTFGLLIYNEVREREHHALSGRWETKVNYRDFFENYAKSKNIDPLLAASWYNLSLNSIKEYPVSIVTLK